MTLHILQNNNLFERWKPKMVFLLVSFVSVFLRFPFFFRDYVDHDESTFILMGQAWAEGHLPYTQLWDLKPPFTFAYFAIIIKLFGKSFFAIRLFGALLIGVTSFFVYRIASLFTSKTAAFFCGLFTVITSSALGSLQGVMSEHLSMVFFVPGLYWLLKGHSFKNLAVSGLLLGFSLMVKLNLAYSVLLIGLWLAYRLLNEKVGYKQFAGLLFVFGVSILLPIFISFLPYYIKGIGQIWWNSVIMAPLHYDKAEDGNNLTVFFKILPFLCVVIWLLIVSRRLEKMHAFSFLPVAALGILYSFVNSGVINSHYMLQLYPLLLVFLAVGINLIPALSKVKVRPYMLWLLLIFSSEAIIEFSRIGKQLVAGENVYYRDSFKVATYLTKINTDNAQVFFMHYHIGYWLLDQKPPSKVATHPSNLYREQIYPYISGIKESPEEEINFIFDSIRPEYIVNRYREPNKNQKKGLLSTKKAEPEIQIAQKKLLENYLLHKKMGNLLIYKRKG